MNYNKEVKSTLYDLRDEILIANFEFLDNLKNEQNIFNKINKIKYILKYKKQQQKYIKNNIITLKHKLKILLSLSEKVDLSKNILKIKEEILIKQQKIITLSAEIKYLKNLKKNYINIFSNLSKESLNIDFKIESLKTDISFELIENKTASFIEKIRKYHFKTKY